MRAYERLLKYVLFATASDAKSESCPSTPAQLEFAAYLADELADLGVEKVTVDEHGYVYAEIPATEGYETAMIPTIGFIAHMDVSDAVPSENISATVVHYKGGELVLNPETGDSITLSSERFADKHLIVTDGTTLLGADDKAGIAEIMTLAELLMTHKDIPHGRVAIAFTPDEEIGRGADLFNISECGADFAYTVDGEKFGEISYENFNAISAKVTIVGKSYHPGDAKNKLVNAQELAHAFHAMLPAVERPEYTARYEGFYHLIEMKGTVEHATLEYILRDHDLAIVRERAEIMRRAAAFLNERCGYEAITLTVTESYHNMAEKIAPHMHLIDNAQEAIRRAGGTPFSHPIRGGTDGARLSFMGLPCPNLGTGGYNFHGRFEFACVEEMDAVVDSLINILVIYAGDAENEQ